MSELEITETEFTAVDEVAEVADDMAIDEMVAEVAEVVEDESDLPADELEAEELNEVEAIQDEMTEEDEDEADPTGLVEVPTVKKIRVPKAQRVQIKGEVKRQLTTELRDLESALPKLEGTPKMEAIIRMGKLAEQIQGVEPAEMRKAIPVAPYNEPDNGHKYNRVKFVVSATNARAAKEIVRKFYKLDFNPNAMKSEREGCIQISVYFTTFESAERLKNQFPEIILDVQVDDRKTRV